MNLTVTPGSSLCGETTVPGDKSISHRAALFAALADGPSHIENFLISGVTEAMLGALTDLGVPWLLEDDTLAVAGSGLGGFHPPLKAIHCGNSATTLRLLAGALAASGIPATLDGTPGLRRRPMDRILSPLQAMGVQISSAPGGCAPLRLASRPAGQKLSGLTYSLPVASAQVKSCLLLAALAADSPVTLYEPAHSRDHSERMLGSMGVEIEAVFSNGLPGVRIIPPGPLRPLRLSIPGDFSAASFLLVAAAITPGSVLSLKGVGLNPTRIGLLTALQEMGANIRVVNEGIVSGEPVGDLQVSASLLQGVSIAGERVVDMIDEFPIFAVAAAFAYGRTEVRQAEELRYKESDRIRAVCAGLLALGVQVEEKPDGFIIDGIGRMRGGGHLDSLGDHRLAMAWTVAGLAADQPITVENAGVMSESFPDFTTLLGGLGANLIETEIH